jgi:hypothetical protein
MNNSAVLGLKILFHFLCAAASRWLPGLDCSLCLATAAVAAARVEHFLHHSNAVRACNASHGCCCLVYCAVGMIVNGMRH